MKNKNYIMIDDIELIINNPQLFLNIIEKYEVEDLPRLKMLKRYYLAEHEILNRKLSDKYKPNNKIVNPFANYITNIYNGYFLGKPVKYTSSNEELYDKFYDIYTRNHEESHNSMIGKDLSIYGIAYELLYTNEFSEVNLVKLNVEEVIPIYDNSIKLTSIGAIRYYTVKDYLTLEETLKVELYTKERNYYYTLSNDGDFVLTDELEHFFGRVPVNIFYNNDEESGDFEHVISNIDAYDKLASDQLNESDSFSDAYMVFKGFDEHALEEEYYDEESGEMKTRPNKKLFRNMKEQKVIVLSEGGDAQWLTKTSNTANVEEQKKTIEDNIHKFTFTPDLSTENLGTVSGISIQYRFKILEQNVGNKERLFKEALMNRQFMIVNILNFEILSDKYNASEIKPVFTRNVPENKQEMIALATALVGVLSEETIVSMLVDDPIEELERIRKEQETTEYDNF